MSFLVKDFLADKRVPGFIKQSSLKSIHKVSKVFPSIGLVNCKKDLELVDKGEYAKDAAIELQYALVDALSEETCHWDLIRAIENKNARLIENGRWVLKLHRDVVAYDDDYEFAFKKGQSLFKVYNKLSKENCYLPKLDTLPEFKVFSSSNINSDDGLQIVFSSDGLDGAWDLLTMSERGFRTCQSWDGDYNENLVGTIADPFTGIIYLTNGKKVGDSGSRMIRRSIVRYVFDSISGKPFLYIDRMYPKFEQRILTEFTAFIKEKTNNEFEVRASNGSGKKPSVGTCFVRLTENTRKLLSAEQPYRDTAFDYRYFPTKDIQAILKHKFARLVNKCSHIVLDKHPIQQANYKGNLQKVIKPDLKFILNTYYRDLAHLVVNDVKPIDDTNEYYNSLIYHYILNKKHLEEERSKQLARHINSYFKLNKTTGLKKVDLDPLLTDCNKLICGVLKEELKRLLSKQGKLAQKLPSAGKLATTAVKS